MVSDKDRARINQIARDSEHKKRLRDAVEYLSSAGLTCNLKIRRNRPWRTYDAAERDSWEREFLAGATASSIATSRQIAPNVIYLELRKRGHEPRNTTRKKQ